MPSAPRPAARVVATLLVALVAASCTSGGSGGGPTTSSPPAAEAGTVRLGVGGDLVVDPAEASLGSPTELMVIDLLHDGLTRLDADGSPQPALADRWVANDTSTAFRFHLGPDATFASGDPVTPEAVIASLERIIEAGDTSLTALSLESVEGFGAFVDGKADHVSGLSAPDGSTVRFALTTPMSLLPAVLSDPLLSVVDEDTVAGGDLAGLDLTGDWAVASADDGGLRLEHRDDRPGDLAAVELRRFDDEKAAYDAFDAGDLDWAVVPTDRFQDALDDHGDDAFVPFQAEIHYGMNIHAGPLANGYLRRAVELAIDRRAIVESVYASLADPLATVVPAGVPGHDAERCDPCEADPDTAAAIVASAFPDGKVPTVHIDFDESDPQQAMAELISSQLEAVGIPTQLRPKPLDEYKRFVVSGDQELFSFGWIGAYTSPDAYLSPLFGSSANDNLTGFRSPTVDGFLDRARLGEAPEFNRRRWAMAESEVLAAAVVVPIAQFRVQVVVSDRVEGLAHAVDGTVDWRGVTTAA